MKLSLLCFLKAASIAAVASAAKEKHLRGLQASGVCDEETSYKPDQDPRSAFDAYVSNKYKFPTIPVGQCGELNDHDFDVDGFPASPARPGLFQNCMFGADASNQCYKNYNHNDLPIVDTYFDQQGRPIDVFAPITTKVQGLNIFASDDVCIPNDYASFGNEVGGFFLYGSPDANLLHSTLGPTVKNCMGRQALVRFENVATRAPIVTHLHGAASQAPYDGWAEDLNNIG
jgi:hypothetical protein